MNHEHEPGDVVYFVMSCILEHGMFFWLFAVSLHEKYFNIYENTSRNVSKNVSKSKKKQYDESELTYFAKNKCTFHINTI